ncbi:hypothetical protein Patl1_20682 [Pistacia atlantica]|uniref:Uncharacterized protein n=1 Tax=Pistacia atlantica TaxID=434234 RepID=A0ACC1BJ92_9ROSI|nr:hypothetical protein Patl1_20682 [Pistacia atlantica]
MIQAYKVQTANAMVEYPSIKQISSAKWHITAIEVPQGLVFLDMSNKQDICRDINPSNIQHDGDVMETSFLPHTPSNSRPENAMDSCGFTDSEASPVLPVCAIVTSFSIFNGWSLPVHSIGPFQASLVLILAPIDIVGIAPSEAPLLL